MATERTQAIWPRVTGSFGQIVAIVQDLTDEQVQFTDARLDERSIAGVTMHAAGAMLFIVGTITGASGERPTWQSMPATKAELLEKLEGVRRSLDGLMASLTDEQLARTFAMPWGQQLSGAATVQSACQHALRHAGTILDLRALGGFPSYALG